MRPEGRAGGAAVRCKRSSRRSMSPLAPVWMSRCNSHRSGWSTRMTLSASVVTVDRSASTSRTAEGGTAQPRYVTHPAGSVSIRSLVVASYGLLTRAPRPGPTRSPVPAGTARRRLTMPTVCVLPRSISFVDGRRADVHARDLHPRREQVARPPPSAASLPPSGRTRRRGSAAASRPEPRACR